MVSDHSSEEWAQEYGALYQNVAVTMSPTTRLAMFVKGNCTTVSEMKEAAAAGAILGYAILRPSPLNSVAESMIDLDTVAEGHHLTSSSSIEVTAEGVTVAVSGLPFMQQDALASRCAHASLWIATSLVKSAFPKWTGCEVIDYNKVSAALSSWPPFSRRVPSGGLSAPEIMLALERSGYDPISYSFDTEAEKAKSDHTVYRWVESGVPVILLLSLESERHSVVVAGHTFDSEAWWPGARIDYFPSLAGADRWYSSSLWAPQYLVLDDNYGPGLAMTRGSLRTRSYAAIVPLPKSSQIYLPPEDAEVVAANMLLAVGPPAMAEAMKKGTNSWMKAMADSVQPQAKVRFVLRTFLTTARQFMDSIDGLAGYTDETRAQLKTLTLPDYVWLLEISVPSIYGDKIKLGEVLLDPRMPRRMMAGTEGFLWMHLPGAYWHPAIGALAYPGVETPSPLLPRK